MNDFLMYYMPAILSAYYIFLLSDIPRKSYIIKLFLFLICLIPFFNITISFFFFTLETINILRNLLNHADTKSVGQ